MTIGIVGGLGPLAGAAFYLRLVTRAGARDDSEHPGVLLVSDPSLPSRMANLLHGGPSPVPGLIRVIRRLTDGGADVIAIPSATSHAYLPELQDATPVPIVDLLAEVPRAAVRIGARRVGVLATTATAELRLYERTRQASVEFVYPDPNTQTEIQSVVDAIKGPAEGAVTPPPLRTLVDRDWAAGCDAILLGCTELHVLRDQLPGRTVIDATDVLVDAVYRQVAGVDRAPATVNGATGPEPAGGTAERAVVES